ncbi:universal stress protein [Niabella terrae]
MQTLVAALDLQENTSLVAAKAAEMAERFQAALHIIHVVLPTGSYLQSAVTDSLTGIEPILMDNEMELIETQKAQAAAELQKIADRLPVKVTALNVVFGDIEDEILGYAKQTGAGMIVMGTHQRSGLDRLLNGETSVRILHETQIPILVVPTRRQK